jgi:hypothetical protein
MNKLSKLIKRLLVIARAPDTKYLIGLNLQAIQKVKGKPQPGGRSSYLLSSSSD